MHNRQRHHQSVTATVKGLSNTRISDCQIMDDAMDFHVGKVVPLLTRQGRHKCNSFFMSSGSYTLLYV